MIHPRHIVVRGLVGPHLHRHLVVLHGSWLAALLHHRLLRCCCWFACRMVMMLEEENECQCKGCKHQRRPLEVGFDLLSPNTRSKILSTLRNCRFRLKARLSCCAEMRFDILLSFVTSSRKFTPCFQARIACPWTSR